MNHRALVNLRVDDLNLVPMDVTKVCLNQGVPGDQKSQRNPVVKMGDQKMDDQKMGDQKMGDQKMGDQKMGGRKMGGRNY
jgi:hypothetical protein